MSDMEYDATSTACSVLSDAMDAIDGPKADEHGEMFDLHMTISAFWSTYLSTIHNGIELAVSPADVATMMELMKIARRVHGGHKRDHYLDAAGYAAIAYAVSYKTPAAELSKPTNERTG